MSSPHVLPSSLKPPGCQQVPTAKLPFLKPAVHWGQGLSHALLERASPALLTASQPFTNKGGSLILAMPWFSSSVHDFPESSLAGILIGRGIV